MKFLTKLWQVAQKVGTVVGLFAPVIQLAVPNSGVIVGHVIDFSSRAISIIKQVELSAQALSSPVSGSDKLKMATPSMAQAILESAAISGRQIANPTLFMQGAAKIADGWADVANSLHENEVGK